jgi:hypothetical protein
VVAFDEGSFAECGDRGAYLSVVLLSLLDLPLELPPHAPARQAGLTTFFDKLPEWLGKCMIMQVCNGCRYADDGQARHTKEVLLVRLEGKLMEDMPSAHSPLYALLDHLTRY